MGFFYCVLLYLVCKFSCRGQNYRLTFRKVRVDPLQHSCGESRRLSGSRLSLRNDIVTYITDKSKPLALMSKTSFPTKVS